MDGRQGRLLWNLGFVSVDGMELESGFAMLAFAGIESAFHCCCDIYIDSIVDGEVRGASTLSLRGMYLSQRS
jgi:hypothetical protein